jgi:NAD(P)-dependent dehydrogenase (short-subunit alcohol dehydrogenase family)
MEQVEGKVAFITGGASGIGFGMAKVFVKAGMKVVIADIQQDQLDRAMAHFGSNPNIHAICLDVTDREAMKRAADEVERVFSKVHVVCNNAGVIAIETGGDPTYEDFDWLMAVNAGGVINGVQTFVPRIKKHGEGGHVVNTASMNAFFVGPGSTVYVTSKFAVRGLTEALRYSLFEHNIGVTMLCPGVVKTGLGESYKTRPPELAKNSGFTQEGWAGVRAVTQTAGQDPVEVGEMVLKAIKNNEFYLFTASGFRDEMRELCEEIVQALPEGEGDPRLADFEKGRRDFIARVKAHTGVAG